MGLMAARRLTLAGLLLLCMTVGSALSASVTMAAEPPAIEEEYSVNVSDSSVTLWALLNPQGSDTTYRFEYGPTTAYGASTPEGGAGTVARLVREHVQDLSASTLYHYRLVAVSSAGTSEGPDRTFTTQGVGAPLTLLDGRQWEMVSPENKDGAGIRAQSRTGGLIQAATDGSGISYQATDAIEGSPEGNRALENAQILARRTPDGWVNRTIDTPNEDIHGLAEGLGTEYRMFTPDLSLSLIEPRSLISLAPGATERTPYLRDQGACEARSSGCYTPLVTPEDTMPGAKWDPNPSYVSSEEKFVSATSDLQHVVIHSNVPLTAGAGNEGLYEWSAGRLRFVSLLPEGEGGSPVNGELGEGAYNMRGALSQDGSRVVWSTGGGLYLRDMQREETIRLDQPGGEHAQFQIANADGSRVFFTQYTAPQPNTLYECEIREVAGKLACNRHEVAGGGVSGAVLGASEDGLTVYFVANEALPGGPPSAHCFEGPTCNLYIAQLKGGEWSVRFIAALASGFGEQVDSNDWSERVISQPVRVSPNGRFLAFMSERSLTGYDNNDAVSGMPDEEAYLYDAAEQRLRCVSCNPTGARPLGMLDPRSPAPLIDPGANWTKRWIAAMLPPWSNIDVSGSAIHQPPYVSDDGRVFFTSTDGLVPQDANGLSDVYEYEPEGVGSCTQSDGCIDLISSGASGEEAGFLDASTSGDDAFFITSARLTGVDKDTAYDVYDAHVCSASVPCVQEPAGTPSCSSGDACKSPPSPQPTVFGEPASATFSGQGNVVSVRSGVVRQRKALTRSQRLARALRACGRRHSHDKRKLAACKRRARRVYGKAARSGHSGRGN